MKKLFILIVLGSFSVVTAEQRSSYQYQANNGQNTYQAPRNVQSQPYYGPNSSQNSQSLNQGINTGGQGGNQTGVPNQSHYQPIQNQPNNSQNFVPESRPAGIQGHIQSAPAQSRPGQLASNIQVNIHDKINDEAAPDSADRELSKNIHESLYVWFSDRNQNLAFEIEDGVVTLTGHVNSQQDKDKIVEALKKIQGVKKIVNKITVSDPKKYAYYNPKDTNVAYAANTKTKLVKDYAALDNDKKINQSIRDKLDKKGFEEVAIITANGVVTLGGIAKSGDELKTVVIEIEKIDGVKKVNNKVSIRNK